MPEDAFSFNTAEAIGIYDLEDKHDPPNHSKETSNSFVKFGATLWIVPEPKR
jgi:hypothetical protein